MAIDNLSKRESVVSTLGSFVLATPIPDGVISQDDRQHIAQIFSGELAAPNDPVREKLSRNRTVCPMPYQYHMFA